MKLSKQAKKYWWLGLIPFVLIGLFIVFKPFGGAVFNIGEAIGNTCKTTYTPTWDGAGVGCAVGKGGWGGSTPIDTIVLAMMPIRADYVRYLADNNIKVGDKCYIDITATKGDNLNSQSPYTETEYGAPHTHLAGTLRSTYTELLMYQGQYTNDYRYFYWEDYKCVLNQPFAFNNNVGNARYIYVTATLGNESPSIPLWVWIVGGSLFVGLVIVWFIYITKKR